MPAVKARDVCCLICGRDGSLVEGRVGGVFERVALEDLVGVDGAIADEVHLGHAHCTRGIVLKSGWKIDSVVDSVILLSCPYESDAGSNCCRTGTGVSTTVIWHQVYRTPGRAVDNCQYKDTVILDLCQRTSILLLWGYSEEKRVTLEEDNAPR